MCDKIDKRRGTEKDKMIMWIWGLALVDFWIFGFFAHVAENHVKNAILLKNKSIIHVFLSKIRE